mgnify:CR=1 FL=1
MNDGNLGKNLSERPFALWETGISRQEVQVRRLMMMIPIIRAPIWQEDITG